MFARRFGDTSTERDAFTTYALQRIHVVNQIGVAKLCRAVQPVPLGPRHMPLSSLRMEVFLLSAPWVPLYYSMHQLLGPNGKRMHFINFI